MEFTPACPANRPGVNASVTGRVPSAGTGEQQAGHGIPGAPHPHAPCSQTSTVPNPAASQHMGPQSRPGCSSQTWPVSWQD
jgi:hypothetical protein